MDEREEAALIEEFGSIPTYEDWGTAVIAWQTYCLHDGVNANGQEWEDLPIAEKKRWLCVSLGVQVFLEEYRAVENVRVQSREDSMLAVLGAIANRYGGNITVLESEVNRMVGTWSIKLTHNARARAFVLTVNKQKIQP